MSRSLFWIDRDELARALVRAGVAGAAGERSNGHHREPAPQRESPFRPLLVSSSRLLLAPPREEAREAVLPLDVRTSSRPLEARLESLVAWIQRTTAASAVFVLDQDGLPLIDTGMLPDLLSVSPFLLSSINRVRGLMDSELPATVSLTLTLGADDLLHLHEVESPLGRMALGFVAPPSPHPLPVASFRQALARIVADEMAGA